MSYAIHKKDIVLQELDDIKRHTNMMYEESLELKQEIKRLNEVLRDIKKYIEVNYETHWQSDMLVEIKDKINIALGSDKE